MKKIKSNYKDKFQLNEMKNWLVEKLRGNINQEIVIVNIGTDRCVGDAVAPLVGTLLKQYPLSFQVYGTLDQPIHALNLEKKLEEIKQKHPNAFFIGIDACLGNIQDIGELQVRDFPIHPGKGVGKTLPDIGDVSIIGIVDSSDVSEIFSNRSIRLNLIYEMSKAIAKIVIEADRQLRVQEDIAISI